MSDSARCNHPLKTGRKKCRNPILASTGQCAARHPQTVPQAGTTLFAPQEEIQKNSLGEQPNSYSSLLNTIPAFRHLYFWKDWKESVRIYEERLSLSPMASPLTRAEKFQLLMKQGTLTDALPFQRRLPISQVLRRRLAYSVKRILHPARHRQAILDDLLRLRAENRESLSRLEHLRKVNAFLQDKEKSDAAMKALLPLALDGSLNDVTALMVAASLGLTPTGVLEMCEILTNMEKIKQELREAYRDPDQRNDLTPIEISEKLGVPIDLVLRVSDRLFPKPPTEE